MSPAVAEVLATPVVETVTLAPRVIPGPLGTLPLLARAAALGARRPQGRVPGDAVPAPVVRREAVRTRPDEVAAYRRVTGTLDDGRLPPAWLETRAFDLLGALVTHPAFPLSPFGLIHTGQRLLLPAPLADDVVVALEARLAHAVRDARGITLTVTVTATHRGALAWRGDTILLSRAPAVRQGGRSTPSPASDPRGHDEGGVQVVAPEDLGRRYARVSDDLNPHHLWALTARPLGYRRPIAHGMWLLARALGELPDAWRAGALEVDARFKRPLGLPGQTVLRTEATGAGEVAISARDPRTGEPHLVATARGGAAAAPATEADLSG